MSSKGTPSGGPGDGTAEDAASIDATMLVVAPRPSEPAPAPPVPESPAAVAPPPESPLILPPALRPRAPRELLAEEPHRFDFDQAVAVAAQGGDPMSLRFRTAARLGYPWGEVLSARLEQGELVLGTFGLIGAGGVLPRHFTATTARENRKRSLALHAFLDMVGGRFAAMHALSGAKYRPTRNPDMTSKALSAAIGMGTPGLDGRVPLSMPTLLYHAGNLASRSRSTERLRAMLEEEAGSRVSIEEFAGAWVRLPLSEQTRIAGGGRGATGQNAGLGTGAASGSAIYDPMARFVIRLGPLPRAIFERFLPGTTRHTRLVELTRLFVGLDTAYAVNLVLARDEVPDSQLGTTSRLGWSSWLGQDRPRAKDAADAIFDARIAPQGST